MFFHTGRCDTDLETDIGLPKMEQASLSEDPSTEETDKDIKEQNRREETKILNVLM